MIEETHTRNKLYKKDKTGITMSLVFLVKKSKIFWLRPGLFQDQSWVSGNKTRFIF